MPPLIVCQVQSRKRYQLSQLGAENLIFKSLRVPLLVITVTITVTIVFVFECTQPFFLKFTND